MRSNFCIQNQGVLFEEEIFAILKCTTAQGDFLANNNSHMRKWPLKASMISIL